MGGATFKKGANMQSLEVKSHLSTSKATFDGDVNLSGATIGEVLSTESATFWGASGFVETFGSG